MAEAPTRSATRGDLRLLFGYTLFRPEGRPFESTTSVSKERWQALRVGDKFKVMVAGFRGAAP